MLLRFQVPHFPSCLVFNIFDLFYCDVQSRVDYNPDLYKAIDVVTYGKPDNDKCFGWQKI